MDCIQINGKKEVTIKECNVKRQEDKLYSQSKGKYGVTCNRYSIEKKKC